MIKKWFGKRPSKSVESEGDIYSARDFATSPSNQPAKLSPEDKRGSLESVVTAARSIS